MYKILQNTNHTTPPAMLGKISISLATLQNLSPKNGKEQN
jgi:hypothetical protein